MSDIDPVNIDSLIGIETQKQKLLKNTKLLVSGMPANHSLLWGAKGTGKSSLVKAVFNHFSNQDLRLIQIDRDELSYFPDIVDSIRNLPYKYILYCDDLSFSEHENQYRHLKSVLEGSIELPPQNVLIYATSNRRHLMPEFMKDNFESTSVHGEIHYSDTIEEKTALADRFGLWLSFYPPTLDEYLKMVDSYLPDKLKRNKKIHTDAKKFSIARGSRSGRTARQFGMNLLQDN